jgi:4-diphosphocytidyl-2-C-methyl-D-erythritol kinase
VPLIRAPAKINLSLEVTGRRPDGFHELVSVMQEVSLADEIELSLADSVRLSADPACGPETENLVFRAARLLSGDASIARGAAIVLRKQIPIGGGLGGGSSDAAATLIALNRLWDLRLSCGPLLRMAQELGSDVPFFLTGGSALVTGRGERVAQIDFSTTVWHTITNPGFHVSTARIFAALGPEMWSSGAATQEVARAMEAGEWPPTGRNALQAPLFTLYPEAKICFDAVQQVARGGALVSGSGPSVVAPWPSREEAEAAATNLHTLGYWTKVVRNCPTEGRDLPCRA